ncbi:MAG TPA: type II toxin-antitoxin system prevent-host-death family antitoxin [Anaerolineae bacterium]|nr:type II toxin-antitoxin system prevent-host-death family antitoxin [Anaerolineae bacterium]
MKIIVSVNELSAETQVVIDNMRRSKAPVLIGDANQPQAVLLSYEEYQRLQSQVQASATAAQTPAPTSAPAPARPALAVPETTQPVAPGSAELPDVAKEPAAAEVVPADAQSEIARRTAAAIQADRDTPAEPKVVSQRVTTLQPDPTLAAKPGAAPPRAARLTRPVPKGLPKPPRPLETPKSLVSSPLSAMLSNWQTLLLVAGVLILGIVGFVLIVNAFGG